MESSPTGDQPLPGALEPFRAAPERAAILCDLDGTLAPIVGRPEAVEVPERTRELLRALAARYALVGVVTGRPAEQAREIVGLQELAYSGNHGFELLPPGATTPLPDPSLDGHERDAPGFVDAMDPAELEAAGLRREDKGAIVALHWRGSPNEGAAESLAAEIASEAEWRGLVPHRGRKVLEVRPNVPINKGIAVAALIAAGEVGAAVYGGDDRTDADAFLALRTLAEDGKLERTLCIAIDSDEAPPELIAAGDLTVAGTAGFLEALEQLAG